MSEIRSYYYFTGETVDGDLIDLETVNAITEADAKDYAAKELSYFGGGHIDAFYTETDEFAFDVEI